MFRMLFMFMTVVFLTPGQSMAEFRRSENRVHERYVVRLADDFPGSVAAAARSFARLHGAKVVHVYESSIKGFAVKMPESAAIALSRNPVIRSVTEDAAFSLANVQAGAHFGLDRIDQRDLPVDGLYHYGPEPGRFVQVYVIDSGVDLHNDIAGQVVTRINFESQGTGDVCGLPSCLADCYGHGTSVASVIAGQLSGVAKAAEIISIKIYDCNGNAYISDLIAGIDWMTSRKMATPWIAAVANMSFATPQWPDIDYAVLQAVFRDITVVAAAGNGPYPQYIGRDACNYSPGHLGAATAGVITVAASDTSDTRPTFSNWGPCADMFAPGAAIRVAMAGTTSSYDFVSGTSFAAPLVAGEAARRLGIYAYYGPDQVEALIKGAATPNRIQNTMSTPNLLLHIPFQIWD